MKTIFKALVGSRAYNTHTPESDTDFVEVYIAPKQHYFGSLKTSLPSTQVKDAHNETSRYELLHFISMCAKGNPNIIPALFSPEFTVNVPCGTMLIDNRHLFLTKNLITPFIGFYLSLRDKASLRTTEGPTGKLGAVRKDLCEKCGYDTKAAYHALRLLNMLCDFLSDPSKLEVSRTYDAVTLKEIRAGLFTKEQVINMLDITFSRVQQLEQEAELTESNKELINYLSISILEHHFYGT